MLIYRCDRGLAFPRLGLKTLQGTSFCPSQKQLPYFPKSIIFQKTKILRDTHHAFLAWDRRNHDSRPSFHKKRSEVIKIAVSSENFIGSIVILALLFNGHLAWAHCQVFYLYFVNNVLGTEFSISNLHFDNSDLDLRKKGWSLKKNV